MTNLFRSSAWRSYCMKIVVSVAIVIMVSFAYADNVPIVLPIDSLKSEQIDSLQEIRSKEQVQGQRKEQLKQTSRQRTTKKELRTWRRIGYAISIVIVLGGFLMGYGQMASTSDVPNQTRKRNYQERKAKKKKKQQLEDITDFRYRLKLTLKLLLVWLGGTTGVVLMFFPFIFNSNSFGESIAEIFAGLALLLVSTWHAIRIRKIITTKDKTSDPK